MTINAALVLRLVAPLLLVCAASCSVSEPCEEAADHLRDCLGEEAVASESCDERLANDLLSKSCDELQQAQTDGKSDFLDFLCTKFGIACNSGPCGCSRMLDPVCGDDGQTYANSCTAECEEITVLQSGECPYSLDGLNQDCPADGFCGEGLSCTETDFCGVFCEGDSICPPSLTDAGYRCCGIDGAGFLCVHKSDCWGI